MESITEWTGKLDKNVRNKPPKQLQEELFHRIDTALEDGTNTIDECVTAFCRFDAKVIEPFYGTHYWNYTDEKRSDWDKAMIRWACTNTGKQSIRATVRIVPIVKIKLSHVQSVDEVLPELKWLSTNGDERSASAFKQLRDNSKLSELKKLLPLDMNGWTVGQVQIFKMYGIIFADSPDLETQKLYAEFLDRHGKSKVKDTEESVSPEGQTESPIPVDTNPQLVTTNEKLNTESAPAESIPSVEDKAKEKASVSVPSEPAKEQKRDLVSITDGVALADALVKWAQAQKERNLEQAERNARLSNEAQKQRTQIENMSVQISELTATLEKIKAIKAELEADLCAAKAENEELRVAKEKAESTIGQVQQMSGNSVKQELDGFKAKLASELANDIKDFRGEYAEEEKSEVYAAFLEDMIDILKSNGISVEEN